MFRLITNISKTFRSDKMTSYRNALMCTKFQIDLAPAIAYNFNSRLVYNQSQTGATTIT